MIITTTQTNKWVKASEISSDDINGKITLAEECQTIRGFGGCFNELGAVALFELPEDKKKGIMSELFSDDGCGFNFCRVPIGANDFALNYYSCNDTDGDYGMKHFTIERDKKYIIPYIKSAMEFKPSLELFASPWSPPAWMKTSKVYNHGSLTETEENLKAYALYFRRFVEEYKKEGIKVTQIHIQNEPFALPKYPCCTWTGEQFRNFIANYLGEELNGIADIFLGTLHGPEPDDRFLTTRYSDYAGYVLQDENCKRYVKGISYQWQGKNAVQVTHDDYPELELIQSESECGDGKNTWAYAMYVFDLMRHYFRNGISSYIYWNMILGKEQISTWGWKQNSMITVKDGEVIYNPEFYLMKHFSAFVKPGAKYLKTNGNWSSNSVAFKNPDGKVVIVTANPYKEDKTMDIAGKCFLLPEESFSTVII